MENGQADPSIDSKHTGAKKTHRVPRVLTDRSMDRSDEEIEMGVGLGSGLAAGRWDGVRKKIGQLHGEASGAAWFPFKEGE
jgi:hypothetical protein